MDQFQEILDHHEIEAIADVRRFPGSRRHPQFGQDALRASLTKANRSYLWLPSLGGRRNPSPDSPNTGWRNASFRAYADHTSTEEFAEGLFDLLTMARGLRTAIMCAEAVWWHCHRGIIADVLCVSGVLVGHITDKGPATMHPYTQPARIVDGRLSYEARDTDQLSLTTLDP
ncbi:MAG: DUF488 domain-containing protein [Gemmatimonadota bacterium]